VKGLPINSAFKAARGINPLTSGFGLAALLVLLAAPAGAGPLGAYPPARRDPAMDDYNGVKVADPYRWLEQLDAPETRDWVAAESRLTDAYLAGIPVREVLKQRLSEVINFEKFGIPFHQGVRYFYSHNSGLQPQSVLFSSAGLDGPPTVAFDPNALSTNGSLAIVGYVASPDGGTLAYGVSQGGSDWTDWHFRDLASGQDRPEVLKWTKYYAPVFARDGQGVYYSAFPAPAPGEELRVRDLGDAIYHHVFGTPQAADRQLYARPDHPDWQFQPSLTQDGRWLVLRAGEGEVGDKGLEDLYVLDLRQTHAPARPLAEGFTQNYLYVGADQGRLFFETTAGAPRGRVVAIDPADPGQPAWQEIVPQGPDTMDVESGSVTLVDHHLIVRTLHDVASQVAIYGLDGRRERAVALPGRGIAGGFGGEVEDRDTFYSFTDMVTPTTIFRLDLESGVSTVYRAPKVAFDLRALESKQVFYPARDGTRIPMTLVCKKGLKRDGTNPTLLYGYGGFGISVLPGFDATRLVWLERGGIFAVANLRGGGEYGEEWHRQAIRARKQIVFDDFISAAEWLIAQGYTSTPKLAIQGGSNGGLLVGACLTQRPDLYGAALAYVGVLDMLRFDQFGQGAGWVGDYGVPHNPEDFKALRAYSPYHNVRPGTHYPATLVITGDHDTRVMPAHSFKFAAALQFAQAGAAPVLLRVRRETGHGAGPTTSQVVAERADAYAFLMQNLGMTTK
jgi:prolyl oligopeptidase